MSRLWHPSTNSLITLEDLVVWLEEFLLNECLLYACHCSGWKEPLLSFTASYSACLLKLSAQQNRLTVHTEETITANGLQVPAFLLEPVNKCKQGHTSSCDAFRGAVRRGTPTDHHGQRGGSLLSTSVRSLTLIHWERLFFLFGWFLTQGALDVADFGWTRLQTKSPCHTIPHPTLTAGQYSEIGVSAKRKSCLLQTLFGYLKGYNIDGFFVYEGKWGRRSDALDI